MAREYSKTFLATLKNEGLESDIKVVQEIMEGAQAIAIDTFGSGVEPRIVLEVYEILRRQESVRLLGEKYEEILAMSGGTPDLGGVKIN